jgi:hypothetical protein
MDEARIGQEGRRPCQRSGVGASRDAAVRGGLRFLRCRTREGGGHCAPEAISLFLAEVSRNLPEDLHAVLDRAGRHGAEWAGHYSSRVAAALQSEAGPEGNAQR